MKFLVTRPRFDADRVRRLIIGVCVLTVLACGGDGPTDPESDEGFGPFTGKWNGEEWQGLGAAVIRNDSLYLAGHRPDPQFYYDEYVNVATPFTGEGTYEIDADGGRLSSVTGGDAGFFPEASGTLRITGYDPESRTLTGTVELTSARESLPWTFLDGAFSVPVYESFAAVPEPPCRRPAPCGG